MQKHSQVIQDADKFESNFSVNNSFRVLINPLKLFSNSNVLAVFSKHDHECVKTSFGNPGGFQARCSQPSSALWRIRVQASPFSLLPSFSSFFKRHSFTSSATSHQATKLHHAGLGTPNQQPVCIYAYLCCIYVGVHSKLHVHVCMKGHISILQRARRCTWTVLNENKVVFSWNMM